MRLVIYCKGVGQVRGVIGIIIIVTIVAHQCTDTGTLSIEIGNAEGFAGLDETLLAGGVDQLVHGLRKIPVAHGIEGKQRVEMDGVTHLALLGILLRDGFVIHIPAEIAIVAEHTLCDGGTEGWVHLTHQYRGLAETLYHPLGKARLLTYIFIIYPEVP